MSAFRNIDLFFFHQADATRRLRAVQVTLGLVLAAYHLGSLVYLRAQLTHPITRILDPAALPEWIWTLKFIAVLSALTMACRGGWWTSFVTAIIHATLAYWDYALFPLSWNYISHLSYFGLAVLLFEFSAKYRPRQLKQASSIALSFALLVVGLIYFQAFLAKLNNSGWDWFLTGKTVENYIAVNGTGFGKLLAEQKWFGPTAGLGTLLFEACFLPLLLTRRHYGLLALAGVGFHLGIWLTMNISFWHLWVFYPALFWRTRYV